MAMCSGHLMSDRERGPADPCDWCNCVPCCCEEPADADQHYDDEPELASQDDAAMLGMLSAAGCSIAEAAALMAEAQREESRRSKCPF